MEEFLATILAYPTIFLTVLLVLVVLYWLMVIVGGVDIDILGGADGAAEGAAEGIAEGAAEGLAEGAAEGLAEGIAEGAAEGLAEGAAEGIGEGIGEGATEGFGEGFGEGGDAEGEGVLSGLVHALSLRGVPVTLTLSIVILLSWMLSFSAVLLLKDFVAPGNVMFWLGRTGIFFGSLFVGSIMTSIALRPMKGLFEKTTKVAQHTVIGHACRITTTKVTASFGQAIYDDGAGDLIISVRCDTPNNGLKRGSKAVIIDYDDARHMYFVEPDEALYNLSDNIKASHDARQNQESYAEAPAKQQAS